MMKTHNDKTDVAKNLNAICSNCEHLGYDCIGTTNHSYTGCIYKSEKGGKIIG